MSNPTGRAALPQNPLLRQEKRCVDILWEHLARRHLEVIAVTGIGRGPLGAALQSLPVWAPPATIVLRYGWELMGAGFICQGNVADPKAIQEETSQRMLICPLCNNVTKILMIKSHNLRFRINGFDVWLALLPSRCLLTPRMSRMSTSQGSRTREGNTTHCTSLQHTPKRTLPHGDLAVGLDGDWT